ncbi:hypothetical protein [Mannheimia pernigra]|uniref:YD repeat-containing protein n=1 Tax=Mannheimia pernigra TaxID=111844 RepID=A0A7D5HRK1_9PAST|nr:hypothetical protein [Mannheimia pernigra]QLB39552.1 hypothetical protein HV559_00885 [Mannheimia pernigra]
MNGTYDVRDEHILDANGNIVEIQYDKTNDGKIDNVTKNTLNAKGEVIEAKYYNQAENGAQALTSKHTFELDANGHITQKTSYSAANILTSIEHYTNNVKGNVVKKLIDNNGDGVDRAEIYTLDVNGYITKTENDIGNNGSIESSTRYDRNALGRITKLYDDNDGDSIIDAYRTNEFDVYGNILKETHYNAKTDAITSIITSTYDSNNRRITQFNDANANGEFDNLDTKNVYKYDPQYGSVIQRVDISPTKTSSIFFRYDNLGRQVKSILDDNNNGIPESNETTRIYSYDNPIWNKYTLVTVTDSQGLQSISKFDLDDAGNYALQYYAGRNGEFSRINFYNANVAKNVDFTNKWSEEELAKIGSKIQQIQLTNEQYSTTLTLDSNIVSKLSVSGLDIRGDATDTVNLSSDFTKVEVKGTKKAGKDVLQAYQAEVDGTTYTVYIDTDIHTVVG